MANGTIVIGNKVFTLAYANDSANAEEINSAIVAGGAVYVKIAYPIPTVFADSILIP